MNFPAIAKISFDRLRSQPAFFNITQFVIDHLRKMTSPIERAKFVHQIVDDYNLTVLANPLVQKFIPCKIGCSGCCHTQVGVTEDEAELLAEKINKGLKIDYVLLKKQMEMGNNLIDFKQLSYENRQCIFLGEDKNCKVYEDRPSVCRTNAVLGEASQCYDNGKNEEDKILRLVKTEQTDMAIMGSFLLSKENGTIAYMIGKILFKTKTKSSSLNPKKAILPVSNYNDL